MRKLGTLLTDARDLLTGDRMSQYGHPRENYDIAARVASAYRKKEFTIEDVLAIMLAVKLARQATHPKRDNLVDAAAYLAIMDDVGEEGK